MTFAMMFAISQRIDKTLRSEGEGETGLPESVVRRGSVFASRGPASSPYAADDARPAPVPRRDAETSVCPGLCHARAFPRQRDQSFAREESTREREREREREKNVRINARISGVLTSRPISGPSTRVSGRSAPP